MVQIDTLARICLEGWINTLQLGIYQANNEYVKNK